MNEVQVDLGNWIADGFDLYKKNFGILVLAALVAVILSSVTLLILAGPMSAGIILITLKIYDYQNQKAEIGDLFKGFGFFLQTLLFLVVWGIIILVATTVLGLIPYIGMLASLCLQLAANAFLMFALFLIVDKQMDFWASSLESINTVKADFWPFLVLSLIASVLGSIGAIFVGFGVIFTLPFYFCILAVAYRNVFSKGAPG